MWLHVTFSLKIVHRRGADRTLNHLVLIEHRKLNDHPFEVKAPHLASLQRHCEFSTLIDVIVPRRSADGSLWARCKPQRGIRAILVQPSCTAERLGGSRRAQK